MGACWGAAVRHGSSARGCSAHPPGPPPTVSVSALPTVALLVCLPMLFRPSPHPPLQWLNLGIFHAIGHAGVYYGFKLGHTIPWVDGFPFNVVSHPQYVGSVATLLGMAALVSGLAMVPNSARHREQRPHWQAGLWRGRRGSLRKPAKCTFAHPQITLALAPPSSPPPPAGVDPGPRWPGGAGLLLDHALCGHSLPGIQAAHRLSQPATQASQPARPASQHACTRSCAAH
jgi:hypothetical protein